MNHTCARARVNGIEMKYRYTENRYRRRNDFSTTQENTKRTLSSHFLLAFFEKLAHTIRRLTSKETSSFRRANLDDSIHHRQGLSRTPNQRGHGMSNDRVIVRDPENKLVEPSRCASFLKRHTRRHVPSERKNETPRVHDTRVRARGVSAPHRVPPVTVRPYLALVTARYLA